jgi:hypothetical protein
VKGLYTIILPVILCLPLPVVPAQVGTAKQASDDKTGVLQVTIRDSSTAQPTAARVRVTRNNNVVKSLPENVAAVMYGVWDHADGFQYQPDSSFYIRDSFQLVLQPGQYNIRVSKGIEYLSQEHVVEITTGKASSVQINLARWINMPRRNWFSGDDHIHMRRSPHEDPLLLTWLQAEDVHVGVMLRMGDFWSTYYEQYKFGVNGVYQQGDYMITAGQEDPRTREVGHALGLAANEQVRFPNEYYYYDKVFDKLHVLDGITGYAHQAESFHGYRGLMLDGLRKKVDALEILQFCVSEEPLLTRHYYHLLDLGFAVTAIAGSDFPWCGNDHDSGPGDRSARIGNARFYTYIPDSLSFPAWKAALKKGHTFVSSGPMLDLHVNDNIPGDTVDVVKESIVSVTADAYGHSTQVPLQRLELIRHGKVIASVNAKDKNQSSSHLQIQTKIKVSEGFWIAARSYARDDQAAHTTPVYVTTGTGEFHNSEMISRYLTLAETYLKELEEDLKKVSDNQELQAWRYSKGLQKRIDETRAVIQQLRVRHKP